MISHLLLRIKYCYMYATSSLVVAWYRFPTKNVKFPLGSRTQKGYDEEKVYLLLAVPRHALLWPGLVRL
jgi:hypothetical protein